MRRAYLVLGWGIIILGVVHMIAATQIFAGLSARALWFVGAGIAIVLLGALNLLNHMYGADAPGLRRVSAAANVLMTVFGITGGLVSKGDLPQFVVVLGLVGGATILSLLSGASMPPRLSQPSRADPAA